MTSKYEKCHKLGEGTYASVYMARNIASNEYVALKEVTIDPEEGTPPTAIREIAYVKSLRNLPNVVQLLDIIYSETKITLVLELCKQDLKRFMDGFRIPGVGKSAPTPQPLPNDIAKDFAYQLLCGVQSLHENRIIHRDLKPQNILLTENNILKIGDFGLARSFGPPTSTYSNEVVTLWYRAPDVLFGSKSYSMPIDIWSVGCIMAEFFLGFPLFRGRNNDDQILAIFKIMGTPDARTLDKIVQQAPEISRSMSFPPFSKVPLNECFEKAPPEAIDLLEKMLEIDPMKRVSAADALKHIYFQDRNC